MIDALAILGRWSMGWLWTPTLAWTLVAGVAMVGLRRIPARRALLRYRLRQALIFSLPATLLLAPVVPGLLPGDGPIVGAGSGAERVAVRASGGETFVAPTESSAAVERAPEATEAHRAVSSDPVATLAGAATAGALAFALMNLSLLLVRFRHLGALARAATPVVEPTAQELMATLSGRVGILRPVRFLMGPDDSVPMTFGWRSPVVIVPRSLTERPEDLRPVLLHELIHVSRADFAWATAERAVCALLGFHPLLWALSVGADRDRESACDAEVVASGDVSRETYAGLLYQLARRPRPRLGIASGLAVQTSQLKRRIETMKEFTTHPHPGHTRARARLAAVALLVFTAGAAACLDVSKTDSPSIDVSGMSTDELLAFVGADDIAQRTTALARLEAQLSYLDAEMTTMMEEYREIDAARERGEDVERWEYQEQTRYRLLNEMYEERLRAYETHKMEAFAAGIGG